MVDYIKNNENFYKTIKAKRGIKKVGWVTQNSQYLRFEQLAKIGNLNDSMIVDLGCGRGDFVDYCKTHNINYRRYIGVDIFPHKFRARDNKTNFVVMDILNEYLPVFPDYIIASGTFNLNTNKEMTKPLIKKCFELCKKGFAFNLPDESTESEYKSKVVAYYDPLDILRYCLKIAGKTRWKVKLIKGYLPHDFTVLMRK
jgi:SAM-dependent methyltransferase